MSAEAHRIARRARMAQEARATAKRRAAKMRAEARRDGEALAQRLEKPARPAWIYGE